jgi:hypothetical protein
MLNPIVLWSSALTMFLTIKAIGSNHVGRSAESRDCSLDGSAGCLLRLEKNELMLVRDDHGAETNPAGYRQQVTQWLGVEGFPSICTHWRASPDSGATGFVLITPLAD